MCGCSERPVSTAPFDIAGRNCKFDLKLAFATVMLLNRPDDLRANRCNFVEKRLDGLRAGIARMSAFDNKYGLVVLGKHVELPLWRIVTDLDAKITIEVELLETHPVQERPDVILK